MLLVAIAALYQGTPVAAQTDVVVYADENYPPYSYRESGEAQGIYAEILKAAFGRMDGYRVTIKPVPWKRGLRLLELGKGFALYPPYRRVEERPYIRPYSTPILDEKVVVFCRSDVIASPRPLWPEDYYGLRIGINAGFRVGGDAFWSAVEEGKIKVDESRGNSENLLKLVRGRLDGYLNDRISILWELKRLRKDEAYREGTAHAGIVEGATVATEQGYLGFTGRDGGRFPFKDHFVEELNAIIDEMKKSGEVQGIVDKYLE
ncbi:MAG: ABC transporter substrate-binding protein [Candidatus Latescibacteria bacterium]|nr:ABC transporter substrate-binding protein [Candidatus Latescibacterota bacterium]